MRNGLCIFLNNVTLHNSSLGVYHIYLFANNRNDYFGIYGEIKIKNSLEVVSEPRLISLGFPSSS